MMHETAAIFSIERLDPDGVLRHRFMAFGVQAKKWQSDVLVLCIEDVDRRIRDGQETENHEYVRQQLVKRYLLNEALFEKEAIE